VSRASTRVAVAVLAAGLSALACATTSTSRSPDMDLDTQVETAVPEPAADAPEPDVAAPVDEAAIPVGGGEGAAVETLAFTTPSGRPVRLEFPRRARSIGRTNGGQLVDGRCLKPEGPGFLQRKPGAACGTDEAVLLLMFAIGEVLREYPDSPPVVIGALSRPEGGPLAPHKSHQSGRDVDVGLYAVNGRPLANFVELPPDGTDFEKTFLLMVNLMATGRVSRILVNYALQPHLYRAAQAMGYDERQLAWIFQFPRGPKAKAGVIRHARGHKRHFHVRFKCPDGDSECVDLP